MTRHFTITLSGDIHHKGYKLRALMLAKRYNICGTVAEKNNNIIIEAEGEENDLNDLYQAISIYHSTMLPDSLIQKQEVQSFSYFEDFIIK